MIAGKIWKAGNSYVVTIPREEMDARGLHMGQLVGIDPIPVEIRPVTTLTSEQQRAGWKTQEQVAQDLESQINHAITEELFGREELEAADQDIEQM